MAAATSYDTHATMARRSAGQWALFAPKAPLLLLLSVSLCGVYLPVSPAQEPPALPIKSANVIMEHSKLICCKLYISETRNSTVIDAIDLAARSEPNNVVVLSKFGDSIYNRVRYTLVSYIISESSKTRNITDDSETVSTTNKVFSPIRELLLKMVETAFHEITNLKENSGTHPRMGVIDDLSFHPLGDANMEDAACLARLVASGIDHKYKVPVFLYGEAHPERKTLGAIRRKLGYYKNTDNEKLLEILNRTTPNNDIVKKESDNRTVLDYARGATTVGAAPFLEGYNVPLRYKDNITRVKCIVKKLRDELGGGREGLPKLLAMELPHGDCIEIGCLFDANHLRADQIQDKVREIATEQGLEDKVEKGYYTDITKEMILVNLYSKGLFGCSSVAAGCGCNQTRTTVPKNSEGGNQTCLAGTTPATR